MGLPDFTGDLFTSYEQLVYPVINLKDVNLIAADIPFDTLYHRTCFYSSLIPASSEHILFISESGVQNLSAPGNVQI